MPRESSQPVTLPLGSPGATSEIIVVSPGHTAATIQGVPGSLGWGTAVVAIEWSLDGRTFVELDTDLRLSSATTGRPGIEIGNASHLRFKVITADGAADAQCPFYVQTGTGAITATVKPAPFDLTFHSALNLWANMPAALTEYLGGTRWRMKADLIGYSEARILVQKANSVAATGATLAIQYSTDSGSTWNYLDGTSGPVVAIDGSVDELKVSSWVSLAASAKDDVLMRIMGENGDGAADPRIYVISCQFRNP